MMPMTLISLIMTIAADAPVVELPGEVNAKPGRLVRIVAKTAAPVVRWVAASDDCDIIPFPDGRTAIFSAMVPGRYRLIAYTALGDLPSEPAICTVIVSGSVPPGPGPPPPGPTPPPPDPPPSDPLTVRLQKLARDDASAPADKRKWLDALIGLMAAAAEKTRDTSILTLGDYIAIYREAVPAVIPDGVLRDLRRAIGEEISRAAGDDAEAAMTAALRETLAKTFLRLGKSLAEVRL